MKSRVRISKFLSFILRHNPDSFGIDIDGCGFARLEDVAEAVKNKFKGAGLEDILSVVKNTPKERFEIAGNKIRAAYGHSIDIDMGLKPVKPPKILYHGTPRKNTEKILKEGLKPMGRKFVHLSVNKDDGLKVGRRRDANPAILKIDAREAYGKGVEFYRSGKMFLSRKISSKYISVVKRVE